MRPRRSSRRPPHKAGATVLPPPPPPPDLIRLLDDTEARIRRRAAIAVGRVGLPEGVPALVRVLQTDADPEVRQMAAFALGLIGDQSAVEPLRAALADPRALVAGRAAEALGLLNDAASAPAIGKMVAANAAAAAAIAPDDARAEVGEAADAFRLGVYALARLKNYDALSASVLAPRRRSPACNGGPSPMRCSASKTSARCRRCSRSRGRRAPTRRRSPSRGSARCAIPPRFPSCLPLIDASRATSGATIEAIRAIGRIGDARGEPVLTKLLYTRGMNPMVRAETLLALGDSAAQVSVDAFVDFLGDPLPTVRLAALQGFAKRDDDTFLTVLSGLDPDAHWSVRAGLATILGSKDPERSLPRLTPMLGDTDLRVDSLSADRADEVEGARHGEDSHRASGKG